MLRSSRYLDKRVRRGVLAVEESEDNRTSRGSMPSSSFSNSGMGTGCETSTECPEEIGIRVTYGFVDWGYILSSVIRTRMSANTDGYEAHQ